MKYFAEQISEYFCEIWEYMLKIFTEFCLIENDRISHKR